jgi:hypothetical protein
MSGARLTIVCDDALTGALRVLECRPAALPSWARVLTEPADILALPNGSRCIGTFTRRGGHVSAAEYAWRERRAMGGISAGLTGEEIDALSAFIAKRDAEGRVSIGGMAVEDLEIADRNPPTSFSPPPTPADGAPARTLSSRWT